MKKFFVILVIISSIIFFSLLVYQGLKYKRGTPVAIEERKIPIVQVPFIAKNIDLNKGIDLSFWDRRPARKVNLLYQLMAIPWPKIVVPEVFVKIFHNREDIFFYFEWADDSQDRITGIKKFSDACAVMFPLGDKPQVSTLMMGFLGKANIWHWKANQDREYWLGEDTGSEAYVDFYYPFEEEELFIVSKEKFNSAVNDLLAIRVGTITTKPVQSVSGRGVYSQGSWKVVIKRRLAPIDIEIDASFLGKKKLCAFAVWNGSKGDRGGRKSISDWVELEIE